MALMAAGMGLAGNASGTLFDRGGGLLYDPDLDITWLSNPRAGGVRTWSDAVAFAAGFSYFDSVRNVTWTDWRLPTTPLSDTACSNPGVSLGFGCTGSEMGHMFYIELPALTGFPFTQDIGTDGHWSGTEFDAGGAYVFFFNFGAQEAHGKESTSHAGWLVRPGDVAAAIPEPESYALLLAGLGLLGFVARRRNEGRRVST